MAAAKYSFTAECQTTNYAALFHHLIGVLGTGWEMAAYRAAKDQKPTQSCIKR